MLHCDISNAQKFAKMFSGQIKWVKGFGGWYIYNGKYWERDNNDKIKLYAMRLFDKLTQELQDFSGDDVSLEKFSKHVKATGANAKLQAMLECAKPLLPEQACNFDARRELFNAKNMTFNMNDSICRPFNNEDLLTKMSGVEIDSKAECPTWIRFLDDIFLGNKELIEFIQRAVGYSLTASVKEQCLFILYGGGQNGKSKFIDTLLALFGDYGKTCPQKTLIKKNGGSDIPNDIASLNGARLVASAETDQNITLDEPLIKSLTGDKKIPARFLYQEFFDLEPTFKIFISTNHKPNIRGTDHGIWRRVKMIPFNMTVAPENDDKDLGEKLERELPGIFMWAACGLKMWKESGLKTPQIVINATNDYREEEDDLGQFIEDYCVVDMNGAIPVNKFKNKFKEINGYSRNQKAISEHMSRNGVKSERRYFEGAQIRCWVGIKFPSIFDK